MPVTAKQRTLFFARMTPEMEEERRNCFVAITRTKECLVLSRAEKYRNWPKAPSRFLVEMGLVEANENN
jgi:DNA helicase II / ATP-dependent DNA helicase PcrA